MRKIRTLLTFLFLALGAHALAQTLSVESFRLLENDLTANTYGSMMRDQNGEVAALIRVVTPEKGFVFDGGMMGIVGTKQDVGEILVYVPHGIQKITVKHEQLGILRDYYFPIPIEKARTYEMKLLSGRLKTVVDDQVAAQFVIFHVTPNNATVTVDGVPHLADADGNVSQLLGYGNHEYRVELPGYKTEAGTVQVGTEKITKEVVLVSSKATITLNCAMSEAELWVNGIQYGMGTWTGEMAAGMYMVEAKRSGYQTRNMAITVQEDEVRSFTVPEPIQIFGHIQIQSTPLDATILIDDVEVGTTPHLQSQVPGGIHKVTVRKKGYADFNTDVEVTDGKAVEVNARLEKEQTQASTATAATTRRRTETPSDQSSAQAVKEESSKGNFGKNSFYLGGFYTPGQMSSYGGQVGFYASNFNVEADYGINGGELEGYWISSTSDAQSSANSYHYVWKFDYTASLRLGFGIKVANSLRVTPQAGLVLTQLKSVDDQLFRSMYDDNSDRKSFYAGGLAALKLEWIPTRHLSLFAAPSYAIPVKMGQIATSLDENEKSVSKNAGGFKLSVGINLIF